MDEKLENGDQHKILLKSNLLKVIPRNHKELINDLKLDSHYKETIVETNECGARKTNKALWHQVIQTFSVILMTASSAMPIGYSAVILPQLYNSTDPLAIDVAMGSWIASIHSAATPFGSFASGPICDYIGRRPTLLLSVGPIALGWIFIAIAQSHFMILLGRFVAGFGVGLLTSPAKVLVTECVEAKYRGILVGTLFGAYSVGILIIYAMGPFMHWRTAAWCAIILPIIGFGATALVYESPIWLARKNKWKQAKKSLAWLRGGEQYAKLEFDQLKNRLQKERELNELQQVKENENFIALLRKPFILKPVFIINGYILLETISGTYIVIFYAVDIIKDFGANVDARQIAIITALNRLVFTILFCYLLHKISRRTTVFIAGLTSGISSLVLASYLIIRNDEPKSTLDLYVAIACMVVYVSGNTGFMALPGVLIGELLPSNVRGRFGAYLVALFTIYIFSFAKIFPYIQPYIGSIGTFIVFGIGSLGAAAFMYVMLPETRNKTLYEIEDYFKGDNWLWARRDKNIHS